MKILKDVVKSVVAIAAVIAVAFAVFGSDGAYASGQVYDAQTTEYVEQCKKQVYDRTKVGSAASRAVLAGNSVEIITHVVEVSGKPLVSVRYYKVEEGFFSDTKKEIGGGHCSLFGDKMFLLK